MFSPFLFGYLTIYLYLSTLYGLSTLFNSSSNHYLSTTLRLSFVPSPSFIAAAMPVSLCFSRCPSISSQRQSNHDSLTLLPRQAGLSPAFPPNPWFTFQPDPLGLRRAALHISVVQPASSTHHFPRMAGHSPGGSVFAVHPSKLFIPGSVFAVHPSKLVIRSIRTPCFGPGFPHTSIRFDSIIIRTQRYTITTRKQHCTNLTVSTALDSLTIST